MVCQIIHVDDAADAVVFAALLGAGAGGGGYYYIIRGGLLTLTTLKHAAPMASVPVPKVDTSTKVTRKAATCLLYHIMLGYRTLYYKHREGHCSIVRDQR